MKMPQIVNLNPQFSRSKGKLSARIGWCRPLPDLCGFSLQDRTSFPLHRSSSLRDELSSRNSAFAAPVQRAGYDEPTTDHRRRRGYRVRTAEPWSCCADGLREDAP